MLVYYVFTGSGMFTGSPVISHQDLSKKKKIFSSFLHNSLLVYQKVWAWFLLTFTHISHLQVLVGTNTRVSEQGCCWHDSTAVFPITSVDTEQQHIVQTLPICRGVYVGNHHTLQTYTHMIRFFFHNLLNKYSISLLQQLSFVHLLYTVKRLILSVPFY